MNVATASRDPRDRESNRGEKQKRTPKKPTNLSHQSSTVADSNRRRPRAAPGRAVGVHGALLLPLAERHGCTCLRASERASERRREWRAADYSKRGAVSRRSLLLDRSVPRPSSSMSTRLVGVTLCRQYAHSSICSRTCAHMSTAVAHTDRLPVIERARAPREGTTTRWPRCDRPETGA